MNTVIKESLKQLVANRHLLLVISLLFILAITFSVIIGLSIHPSELQLVSHYSAFGLTHLYRDQWFYLLVFVAFELIVVVLHSILSIKILVVKDCSLAIAIAWFGIGIVILGFVMAMAVLNVWTPI